MTKLAPKLLARKLVLSTLFPPFLQLYRFFYSLVIHLTAYLLYRYPSVKAVYLRRGGTGDNIIPLVSDLDFAVIVEEMKEKEKTQLTQTYHKLARVTTVLDSSFEVYERGSLGHIYHTTSRQYRFMEGKAQWKLLYGIDCLADLPALPIEKMSGSLYREIKIWWTIFCWRLLQERKYHNEAITRNTVCYKTVTEMIKMDLAINHNILIFSKTEAIEHIRSFLNRKERALLEKLEPMPRNCFRSPDEGIVEETMEFLLTYLDRFYDSFRTNAYCRQINNVSQKVDCSLKELFTNSGERIHIDRLLNYIKKEWSYSYVGAHLVSGSYFEIDELLLMVEVDPEKLPTEQELTALNLFHWSKGSQFRFRIHLYLLLPHAAFQIDADYLHSRSTHSMLCPYSNPDIFELLGQSEFTIDGSQFNPLTGGKWTPLLKTHLQEQMNYIHEHLEDHLISNMTSLEFMRLFWKGLQLFLIYRSAINNEILYPLTLPAIDRALRLEGLCIPPQLKPLAIAYRDEIEGKPSDITALIPESTVFLKEIYASMAPIASGSEFD